MKKPIAVLSLGIFYSLGAYAQTSFKLEVSLPAQTKAEFSHLYTATNFLLPSCHESFLGGNDHMKTEQDPIAVSASRGDTVLIEGTYKKSKLSVCGYKHTGISVELRSENAVPCSEQES